MMSIKEVRVLGLGNGFEVLNPADGYRQDNTLWFGECSVCGERISNSLNSGGVWEHELILNAEYDPDGRLSTKTSTQLDYCPKTK